MLDSDELVYILYVNYQKWELIHIYVCVCVFVHTHPEIVNFIIVNLKEIKVKKNIFLLHLPSD